MLPHPILLISRQLSCTGGTERQIAEIAKALDRSRFETHVGCFDASGVRADELRSAGVPVVQFSVGSFLNKTAIQGALELRKYVAAHKISIVHTFDVPANIFGVLAARACGCRYVISSQRAQRSLSTFGERSLLKITDQLSDRIVVNCDAVRQELTQQSGTPASKIRLVYNGLDTGTFHVVARQRKPEIADAAVTIGVVCALRPEKDIETLLRAFQLVLRDIPEAVLVIVGSGTVEARLRALADELEITRACRFVPTTRDVAEWMRSMDIFVLPSVSEAFSNAIMEAMACGCPVVASRVGGNPELVDDGKTGFLFPVRDHHTLAARLRILATDRHMRQQFGAAAAERIQREFSIPQVVRKMEAVYDELLEDASVARVNTVDSHGRVECAESSRSSLLR